ncbi:J domain-containing protein [Lachnospiraceae bacterium OttesenSCG-928-D06]|nr:J domain-containing protein [Lachnospiraceae bacterium OttesenSCG-928-D06]
MKNILKIIKINILSMIAFPLLLISVCAKLLAKAMEKLLVIVGACVVLLLIVLGFEFLKNPMGGLNVFFTILAVVIVFGLIIAVLFFIVSICSAVFVTIVSVITMVFEGIYSITYSGYAFLYDICMRDFDRLEKLQNKWVKYAICLIFTLLRGLNLLVIMFASFTMILAILASLAVIVLSLFQMNKGIQNMFGISIFKYLSLFSTIDIVYGCVLYLAVIGFIVIIFLSLGAEWSEWGQEMKLTTSGSLPIGGMNPLEEEMLLEGMDEYLEYIESINQHMGTVEEFSAELTDIMAKSENLLIRSSYGNYMRILKTIVETISVHEGKLSEREIKKLIPDIKKIDKLKVEILKSAEKIRLETKNNQFQTLVYFSGCDDKQRLDKRYKSLCKTYHPDGEAGDEETFKAIQAEYEKACEMIG